MKTAYERAQLNITVFDAEQDVIITSGTSDTPVQPVVTMKREKENAYRVFGDFNAPRQWF